MKPVIVVGGGPAGSTVATLLAQDGIPVVLLDRARFPRPKACGECLNPGAVRELRELGWADQVEALRPGLLHGWSLQAGHRRFQARFPAQTVGWGVDRVRLDALMLDRARQAGVEVREGCRVTNVQTGDQTSDQAGGPVVTYVAGAESEPATTMDADPPSTGTGTGGQESTLQGSMVVAADGLRSTVAASLGLRSGRAGKASCTFHVSGVDLDRRLGHMHLAPGPTVGVAPLSSTEDVWTVTIVGDSPETTPSPDPLISLAMATRAFPELKSARVISEAWMSGSFQVEVSSCTAPGILLVGDAAGYYDPLTGQGIYRALRMARWAAEAVKATVGTDGACPEYAAHYAARVAALSNGRRLQQVIEWARRRPRLLERAMSGLELVRGLDPLIALTGDLRIPTS